jgi:hypothetical protein
VHCPNNIPDRVEHDFYATIGNYPSLCQVKTREITIMNDGSFIKIEAVLMNLIFYLTNEALFW